jgi:hypothetical protein
LDSANSLRVIELLHSISRSKHSTVVFSIHQPRPEAFALIDNLILLSNNGEMVYSGSSSKAADFLCQFPGLEPSTLSSISQNPADFIIDILGLHRDKDALSAQEESLDSNVNAVSAAFASSKESMGTELAAHFRHSKEHFALHRAVAGKLDIPNLKLRASEDGHAVNMNSIATLVSPFPFFIQNLLNGTLFDSSHSDYRVLNVEEELSSEADVEGGEGVSPENTSEMMLSTVGEASSREKFILHVWILFARRVAILRPNQMEIISFCVQIVAVAVFISIAFSYDVKTSLEEPYQVVMLIFLLSSYAMMIQYLKIIPEYFVERKIITTEIANGYVNCVPYIFSALLTETPRAVVQTIALNGNTATCSAKKEHFLCNIPTLTPQIFIHALF